MSPSIVPSSPNPPSSRSQKEKGAERLLDPQLLRLLLEPRPKRRFRIRLARDAGGLQSDLRAILHGAHEGDDLEPHDVGHEVADDPVELPVALVLRRVEAGTEARRELVLQRHLLLLQSLRALGVVRVDVLENVAHHDHGAREHERLLPVHAGRVRRELLLLLVLVGDLGLAVLEVLSEMHELLLEGLVLHDHDQGLRREEVLGLGLVGEVVARQQAHDVLILALRLRVALLGLGCRGATLRGPLGHLRHDGVHHIRVRVEAVECHSVVALGELEWKKNW